MRQKYLLILIGLLCSCSLFAQDVQIDSRLRPLLKEFFHSCREYDIPYRTKLFNLQHIDIVNSLPTSERDATLGMLRRDENSRVHAIEISWMAQIDPEILKVVAFHEFAHYFLEYDSHVCDDCNKIMAKVNTSYFDIVRDWEEQIELLFVESPVYQNKHQQNIAATGTKKP